MSEQYLKTYGLRTVPFSAMGAIDNPKYRVVVPRSALGLIEELGKAVEADQAELVIVRGVVGSGKTRLLSQICRMLEAKNFGKLEEATDSLTAGRLAGLKMRRGFGFNVELDQLNIVGFEKRFHDAIIEFLPDSEMRRRFNSAYSSKVNEERRTYKSETMKARKLIADMIDILRTRFRFDYFLICIDEFDIILPPSEATETYHAQVTEFLNALNEMSKEISNRKIPALIALLQTHYANEYFHQYVSQVSDATGSRITPRFDIMLGYDYDEMRDFVVSRLEKEHASRQANLLHPFNEDMMKVLFNQFADKASNKVLSLRAIEQTLLSLLELGIEKKGLITVEMVQQAAQDFLPEKKAIQAAPGIPPHLLEQATADMGRSPLEKANLLAKAIEKALKKDEVLTVRISDKLEPVDINNNMAVLRGFYELVHGNNRYDVAIIYAVFKTVASKDLEEYVADLKKVPVFPQKSIIVAFAPSGGPAMERSDIIRLGSNELQLLFSTLHVAEVPETLARQLAFTVQKIPSTLAGIKDVSKGVSIPAYCIRTLAAVILADLKGQASVTAINKMLSLLYGKDYDVKVSEYLSRLRENGLVIEDSGQWKPSLSTSLAQIVAVKLENSIPRDYFKTMFPDERGENLQKICLELGLCSKDGTALTRRGADFWRKKWQESSEMVRKHAKQDADDFREASELEKQAKSASEPWSSVAYKFAFEVSDRVVQPLVESAKQRTEVAKNLGELKKKVERLKSPDKYFDKQKTKLLDDIQEALKTPQQSRCDQLSHEYDILVGSLTEGEEHVDESGIDKKQIATVLGATPVAKGHGFGPVEEAIDNALESKALTFEELCKNLTQFSRDTLKTVVDDLLDRGTVKLIGSKEHARKN